MAAILALSRLLSVGDMANFDFCGIGIPELTAIMRVEMNQHSKIVFAYIVLEMHR